MSDDKILMNFSNIVLSYAVNATIHLGLSPDPATGQIAIDLNRAKDLILIWIKAQESQSQKLSWEPAITGSRLANWIGHREFLTTGSDLSLIHI